MKRFRAPLSKRLVTIYVTLITFVANAQMVGESIKFSGNMNGRESAYFYGKKNIKALVPKNTEARILSMHPLSSGSFALEVKVEKVGDGQVSGRKVKEEEVVWVHYNMNDKRKQWLELYNKENQVTSSLEEAYKMKATKDGEAEIPTPQVATPQTPAVSQPKPQAECDKPATDLTPIQEIATNITQKPQVSPADLPPPPKPSVKKVSTDPKSPKGKETRLIPGKSTEESDIRRELDAYAVTAMQKKIRNSNVGVFPLNGEWVNRRTEFEFLPNKLEMHQSPSNRDIVPYVGTLVYRIKTHECVGRTQQEAKKCQMSVVEDIEMGDIVRYVKKKGWRTEE